MGTSGTIYWGLGKANSLRNFSLRITLVLTVLISAFLVSGCSLGGNEIKNLAIVLDEDFEGTMGTLPYEPVYLKWESSKLSSDEQYRIKVNFSDGFGEGDALKFEKTTDDDELPLTTDGSENKLRLTVPWNEDSLFYFFAVAKSGDVARFTVQKLDKNGNTISESKLEWVRHARLDKPADPVLQNLWTKDSDNYYRYSVSDKSILTYKSFPEMSIEKCIGVCSPESNSSERFPLRDEIWGWNVKGAGNKVRLQRTVSNEKGKSEVANLEIVSNAGTVYQSPSQPNPFLRDWSDRDKDLESLAKTVWCIENGFRNYTYSKDECNNEISR